MSLQVLLRSATAKAPTRGSAYAAGYDLYAYVIVVVLEKIKMKFLVYSFSYLFLEVI